MATTRILFSLFCFIALGWCNNAAGHILKVWPRAVDSKQAFAKREQIVRIARTQLNVREATGKNDGREVEQYLSYTGHRKGASWCAAFISWVFGKAGFHEPNTAWSPALFPAHRQTNHPLPADVFGIYFPSLKRIAHCGLIEKVEEKYIVGIEGNTNNKGSREGDGVYRKRRHKLEIRSYANWVGHERKEGGNAY